jgi:hypothetical protein
LEGPRPRSQTLVSLQRGRAPGHIILNSGTASCTPTVERRTPYTRPVLTMGPPPRGTIVPRAGLINRFWKFNDTRTEPQPTLCIRLTITSELDWVHSSRSSSVVWLVSCAMASGRAGAGSSI